jgi:hypothetical protein
MKKNNDPTWKTKYGVRRLRNEAPTLGEAIFAAQGLSADVNAQAEIAASLMGLSIEEVRAELLKMAPARPDGSRSVRFVGSDSQPRTVMVERKPSRRISAAVADRPGRAVWNPTARNWR